MLGLSEGRIVHYVAYNDRHLAGIIIGYEEDGTSDLGVFTNMRDVSGTKNLGLNFHPDIKYSETKEPGTWHWPERV